MKVAARYVVPNDRVCLGENRNSTPSVTVESVRKDGNTIVMHCVNDAGGRFEAVYSLNETVWLD